MTPRRLRLPIVVAVAVLGLLAGACDSTGDSTTIATETTTVATASTTQADEGFTYNVGIGYFFCPPNFWAYLDGPGESCGDVMDHVFAPTKPSLFRIAYPGIVVAPDVAVGLPELPISEGDVWTVTQPIRDDYTWSDGSMLTADDIVFTYETVRDTGLAEAWLDAYPHTEGSSPRLLSVEAVDDFTVKYTFDSKPGAAIWPHEVGLAPIMPRAPWETLVAEAMKTENPASVLIESDAVAVGDLSGGPMRFNGLEDGVSLENVRNEHYANEGFVHQFWADGSYALNGELLHGEGVGPPSVEYTEGPFIDRTVFTIYEEESAGPLAVIDGEIDYWFASNLSVDLEARRRGQEADNLAVTVNPNNAWQYLAFNLRKSPGKYHGFRQAMAYFDRETLATNVLQGAYLPIYALVPEGNQAWHNEDIAREIAAEYVGLDTDERRVAAYAALEADGFTWETPAVFDEAGGLVSPGAGLVDPDGTPVTPLEIVAPSASFRPDTHAAALWLEDWGESLGIPVKANPTDFTTVFGQVWPGVGLEPTFDMYILAWELGNPAWPTFHEAFFHTRNLAETNDGGNTTGYSNPDFDAIADAMLAETDQRVAFDQVWEMERMIARDLPYVLLFYTPVTEFYSAELRYPFTQSLRGIQHLDGMQGTVSK